jgi:hypothetical protein
MNIWEALIAYQRHVYEYADAINDVLNFIEDLSKETVDI